MSMELVEPIVSITDVNQRIEDIINQLADHNKPLVIMVNGEAKIVLMSAHVYENLANPSQMNDTFQPLSRISSPVIVDSSKPTVDPSVKQTFRKFKDFWQEFKHVYQTNA